MAAKLRLTVKTYAAYEKDREPMYARRLEIARAMGLEPTFFEAPPPDESIRSLQEGLAAVRGELAALRREIRGENEDLPGQREEQPRAESG